MNEKDLFEAAEILVEEVEAWPTTADGNVMTALSPSDDQEFDFRVRITFYPLAWRDHPDGEKLANHFSVSLEGEDWDGETRERAREYFREALESIDRQYEAVTLQRSGDRR
jgi:hypothetical protein